MIDCDVHQNFNRLADLLPWLDPQYRDFVEHGGFGGLGLPNYPWVHPGGFTMNEADPADGGVAGSEYGTLCEQLLDRQGVEYAILTGEEILNVSCLPHPQLAAALATAYNRWLIEQWLARDERLRGSLVIASQDAPRAAQEIRAFGEHPQIVQVILSGGAPAGYGDMRYEPILDAAVELGLPVAIHVGAEGLGMNPPPTATGHPAYYVEWHTLLPAAAQSHLVSLICRGAFARRPELRLVLVEAGVSWLPSLLWRLDANWKALRSEIPWVREPPSETVSRQVRFTTQPLEQPADHRHLRQALEMIDGIEHVLMYASDYPHWDFDPATLIRSRLPREWRDRIMSENARELYRLPVAKPSAAPDPVRA
ncbi:MAG: amidohydrolase family protein [Solirubrobacteraceae bacterium]